MGGRVRELSVAIRRPSQSSQLGLVLASYHTPDGLEISEISEIESGGVASRSALRTGDRVVAINGQPVHDHESATLLLQGSLECVELLVHRLPIDGEESAAASERNVVKVPALAAPQLGAYGSSGRAWRLWAARHSLSEAQPLGAQATGRPATASGARASRLRSR